MSSELPPVKVLNQWSGSGLPKFALILLLDGKDTFTEIHTNSQKIFDAKLIKWKALELPILKRSDYNLWIVKTGKWFKL